MRADREKAAGEVSRKGAVEGRTTARRVAGAASALGDKGGKAAGKVLEAGRSGTAVRTAADRA